MFKKVKAFAKKLAKKIKEVVKHIVEKAEESIMNKEEARVKMAELAVNTAKDAAKGIGKAVKYVNETTKENIDNLGKAVYEHPVLIMVAGAGTSIAIGAAVIADKKIKNN